MVNNQSTDDLARSRKRLADVLRALADACPALPGRRHGSVEDIVLEYGRWFTPWPLPLDRNPGPPRRCFANAARHANVYGLTYVEGYATAASGAPFPHAWCARPDGTVEDPTWNRDVRSYLGIPFTEEFVRHQNSLGHDGPLLFEQYLTGWQLLQEGIPANAIANVGHFPADSEIHQPSGLTKSRPAW